MGRSSVTFPARHNREGPNALLGFASGDHHGGGHHRGRMLVGGRSKPEPDTAGDAVRDPARDAIRVTIARGSDRDRDAFPDTATTDGETFDRPVLDHDREDGHAAPKRTPRPCSSAERCSWREAMVTAAYVDVAEVYDPGTGRWVATGKMQETRSGHTATRLADGRSR